MYNRQYNIEEQEWRQRRKVLGYFSDAGER